MNRQDTLENSLLELLSERLPAGVTELGQDLRHNRAALLKESLGKMDLVTREEFDVQARVLARAPQGLGQMGKKQREI